MPLWGGDSLTTAVGTLTFIVLEDHALVREGIEARLAADFPTSEFAYSGDSLSDAVAVGMRVKCDLVVLDLDLGDGRPVAEVVSALTVLGIPVVVVSALGSPAVVQAALLAGASAFVPKRAGGAEMCRIIRGVLDGESMMSTDLAAMLVRPSSAVALSPQERQALVLYASGLTINAVARRMGVAPSTVKQYIDRVRGKFTDAGITARNKVALARAAQQEGLLP